MAASINDKFRLASGSTRAVPTTLSLPMANGATTAELTVATGWNTTTAVDYVMYRRQLNVTTGLYEKDATTQIEGRAILTGTTLSARTVDAGVEPASGYAADGNTIVICAPTSQWGDDLVSGILTYANQDGTLKTSAVTTAISDGTLPRLRTENYYTSSGTWTKPAGMANGGFIIVEVIGGGGGGGGCQAAGAGNSSCGASGGGGGYSRIKIAAGTLNVTETYVVGAAGAAGAVGAAGGNGGSSTFGTTPYLTGGGGAGGSFGPSGSGIASQPVAAGGIATGGDMNVPGNPGGISARILASLSYSGNGGNSGLGFGSGGPSLSASGVGVAGSGYGGGGSGGVDNNTTTARTGGAGSKGLVVVREYY